MNKRLVPGIFIASIALFFSACHRTQPAPAPVVKLQLSDTDKDFVKQAEAVDAQEQTIAQLVKQRSRDKELQKYADTVETVHSADLEKLGTLTQKYDVKFDAAGSTVQPDTLNQFKHLSGRSLDVHFVDLVIQDHQKDVGLFQQEARWAKDSDLKDYANSTLPTLESHLKEAEQLQAKLDHPKTVHTRKR